jgi:galactose mutarotase-like enzyme
MAVHIIENECLRVGITPAYGARIVSLLDKSSGREWMTQGTESPNTGEDAVYSSPEAVGWDECFPTVGKWDGTATAWGRPLRDHGDLWGRPWTIERATGTELDLSFTDRQFVFSRALSLENQTLIARYAVTNRTEAPLPFLWALHALLAVREGDRMDFPGLETLRATYASSANVPPHGQEVPWPGTNGLVPFPLDQIQPRTSHFAGKFIIAGVPGSRARIGQAGGWLELSWDNAIADLGLWITYGAWPKPGGHYEVAIEPSSAPADHLGQAIEGGAEPLHASETRQWEVRMRVSA